MRKRFGLVAAFFLALIFAGAVGAGVNGIFTSVTSSSGYQVAGAAGTSGQALVSNGTYFATPQTLFYQTVQHNGTPATQESTLNLIGGTGVSIGCSTVISSTACTFSTTGTARTCNGAGCYAVAADGTITEWVDTSVPNNSTASVTLPFSIPTAVLSIVCSDNGGRVQSGNDQPVGANVVGLSAPFTTFWINSPATGMNAYCTITGY